MDRRGGIGRGTVLLALAALGPADVSAREPLRLTLTQCVERALQRHPRLALADSEIAIQQGREAEARAAARLPQLRVTAYAGPVAGARGTVYDPRVELDFGDMALFFRSEATLLQPVYTFGRLEALVDAAHLGVSATRHARQQTVNEIRRDVQRAYYGLLLARAFAELAGEVADRLATAQAKIRDGLAKDTGQFTPVDSYRLEALRVELTAQRLAAQASGSTLLLALKTMIGSPAGDDVDIADGTLMPASSGNVDAGAAVGESHAGRPELLQLQAAVEARSFLTASARASVYPQLFAGASLTYGYAPNRTDQHNPFVRDDFNTLQGGVAIGFRYSVDFGQDRARIAQAVSEERRAEARRDLARALVEAEVRQAVTVVDAARATTEVREAGARAARAWLSAAESSFDMGMAETRDLAEAYHAYVRSRAALLQALHDERVALVEAAHAKGDR